MNRQSEEAKLFSARFKRDYVAYMAVVLFFLIVASELVMAISIPILVKHQELWDRQTALQEMAAFFDTTRDALRGTAGSKNERIAGEAGLLVHALDELALYLRRNREDMSIEQVNTVNTELDRIPPFRTKLQAGKALSEQKELNYDKFMNQLEAQIQNSK